MTWPIAIFGCFSVLVLFTFLFLTIVYIKEYRREEKAIKQYMKLREEQVKAERDFQNSLMKMVGPAETPKKKKISVEVSTSKSDKDKKDIN